MMRRIGVCVLGIFLGAVACKGADSAASTVSLTFGEKKYELKYGKAMANGDGFLVRLSSQPVTCAGDEPKSVYAIAAFYVSAGPDGGFYAGQPFGAEVVTSLNGNTEKASTARADQAAVTLTPFKYKAGERVRGSLDYTATDALRASASGAFDVEICAKDGVALTVLGQPAEVSEVVTGTFRDMPFTAKSAILRIGKDELTQDEFVSSIDFYDRDRDCRDVGSSGKLLKVTALGGGGRKKPLAGAQPATAMFSSGFEPDAFGGRWHNAWVKLENLDFTRGARVKGSLYADSAPETLPRETGKIGGTFEAKVCPLFKSPPKPNGEVLVTVDETWTAAYGTAHVDDDGLEIVMTDKPQSCEHLIDRGSEHRGIRIRVPFGPGGNFFDDKPIAAELQVLDKRLVALPPRYVSVSVQNFKPNEFARVAGKIDANGKIELLAFANAKKNAGIITAKGKFEIELCERGFELKDAPAEIPAGPAHNPQNVELKSALAFLSRSQDDVSAITRIAFYEKPNLDCATTELPQGTYRPVGADSRHSFVGVPVPAMGVSGAQWVKFGALELKAGTTMRGAVISPFVTGSFEGKVCAEKVEGAGGER